MTTRQSQMYQSILHALAVAAVAELVLNRAATRVGIFIPKTGLAADAYSLVVLISKPLFLTTLVLAMACVLLMMGQLLSEGTAKTPIQRLTVGILALAIVGAVILGQIPSSLWVGVTYNVVVMASVALLVHKATPERHGLILGLAVVATLSLLPTVLAAIGQTINVTTMTALIPWVTGLGEALLVVMAIALAASFGRWPLDRRSALLATLAALIFCGVYLMQPAIVATLSIWTVGLTLYLPFPVYGMAVACWWYAFLSGWNRAAMLILLTAGYTMVSSLQSLLLISAVGALAMSPATPRDLGLLACSPILYRRASHG